MGQPDPDADARAALRARQGGGARYDAANAPAGDLLLARRGAAFFARQLNALPAGALALPAVPGGKSPAQIIAEISYDARAIAIALKGLREGLTAEEAAWRPNIPLALTLPDRALRSLYQHSDVHLNVEFRDLSSANWDGEVSIAGTLPVSVRCLPQQRARLIWQAAVDLGAGARPGDIPRELLIDNT